jgi:phosphatidylserine decarboxylase
MNSGHANQATIRLALWSLAALVGLFVAAWAGRELGGFVLTYHKIFIAVWGALLVVIVYLSRDPDPAEPSDLNAIVSPAHGRVEVIEDATENEFVQGACKRIAIRVALTDVQMQYAPLTATVACFEHRRAIKEGGVAGTENLLIGFDAIGRASEKIAVRLIGGAWGKRILPWVKLNDVVSRSARISMMRPASRVELFLPTQVKLLVNVGDELAGGQSVVAKFA